MLGCCFSFFCSSVCPRIHPSSVCQSVRVSYCVTDGKSVPLGLDQILAVVMTVAVLFVVGRLPRTGGQVCVHLCTHIYMSIHVPTHLRIMHLFHLQYTHFSLAFFTILHPSLVCMSACSRRMKCKVDLSA